MVCCLLIGLLVAALIVLGALLVLFVATADCNVTLKLYELFGKKPEKLRGKIIWITGASSGIGEALAVKLASVGAKLVISARREAELERVKALCLKGAPSLSPEDILILPMDVVQLDKHEDLLSAVVKHFGQLDILINNAGRTQRARFEHTDIAVDKDLFELNVFSVVHLSRIAVRYFTEKKVHGHIVVMSSMAGRTPFPYSSAYTGSKHALHGYFESLRTEFLWSNLDVTLICPGPVVSNNLSEVYTENPNEKVNKKHDPKQKRMPTERCAELTAIAIVNRLDEAWMALFPLIEVFYVSVYAPILLRLFLHAMNPDTVKKLLGGSMATIPQVVAKEK